LPSLRGFFTRGRSLLDTRSDCSPTAPQPPKTAPTLISGVLSRRLRDGVLLMISVEARQTRTGQTPDRSRTKTELGPNRHRTNREKHEASSLVHKPGSDFTWLAGNGIVAGCAAISGFRGIARTSIRLPWLYGMAQEPESQCWDGTHAIKMVRKKNSCPAIG